MNKAELLKGYTSSNIKGYCNCMGFPCGECFFTDFGVDCNEEFDVTKPQYYQLIKLLEDLPSDEITLAEFLELKKQLK